MSSFDDLAARARSERVIVIGGGIGGLVAARECAKVGLHVTLVESSDRLGGAIWDVDLGGQRVPMGANSWSTRSGVVDQLVAELGLADRVIEPVESSTWLAHAGQVFPYPAEQVLGIPANVWDERVRGIIGGRATWRAYLDRVRPPLTIGQQRNLGELVRARMGRAVRDQLVAPLTRGRYGVDPAEVDVTRAAPGLSAALTRTGSLAGGVGQLLGDTPDTPPLRGLAGGLGLLVDAAEKSLLSYGVEIRRGAAAVGLTRTVPTGEEIRPQWTVGLDSDEGPVSIEADAVIVATGAADAAGLLSIELPELLQRELVSEMVTLVVAAPPSPSCRTTVYSDDPDLPLAIVDETARWGGSTTDRRVVRVSLGAVESGPPSDAAAARADDEVCLRVRELSGIDIPDPAAVAIRRERWVQPLPGVTLGREDAADAVRRLLHDLPGVALTGAWIAGSGLAAVIAHARDQAERIRVKLLWDEPGDGVTLDEDHPLDKREETP